MNRLKSRVSLIALALVLVFSMFTGCSSKNNTAQQSTTNTVTDDAGRKVTIPSKIDKVYYTSPIGNIMVYCLAPDKMAGWALKITDKEKKYVDEKYWDLPYLGSGSSKDADNEGIIKAKPGVILYIGPDSVTSEATKTAADKMQEQLKIPVLVLDGKIKNTKKTLIFLGNLLDVEDRAKELVTYCNKTMNDVVEKTKAIPDKEKVRVYYAEGPDGLATEGKGSPHAALLDIVNAVNVANIEVKGGKGMSEVSIEQVLNWNPDVILSWGTARGGAYDKILSSPEWKNINAVKNNKVYEVPNVPFNWFDRPPSLNRYLGLKWLPALMYPNYYKVDMVKETKDFYNLFYHVNLTDEDAKALLKNSGF